MIVCLVDWCLWFADCCLLIYWPCLVCLRVVCLRFVWNCGLLLLLIWCVYVWLRGTLLVGLCELLTDLCILVCGFLVLVALLVYVGLSNLYLVLAVAGLVWGCLLGGWFVGFALFGCLLAMVFTGLLFGWLVRC